MSITDISVKRPAALIMAVLLLLGLGVIGYTSLGANLLPSVETPIISITTIYNGAGVEEIQKDIVKPIEDQVSTISGIDTIRSGAMVGYAYTVLQFTMETDVNTAFMDVQQALGDITHKLPQDAEKPVLKKFNKNAEPIIRMAISGSVPYEVLYNQSDRLKKELEKIPGVANVNLQGAFEKKVAVDIHKDAMEHYGVNINTVVNKLLAENISIPAGEVKQDARSQMLRVVGDFETIDDIKNLRIPSAGGGMIRLADIADVQLAYPDADEILRLNGHSSIGVSVQKQSDANIVKTAEKVKEELESFKKTLPAGMNISIAGDESKFINGTLEEVKRNVIEGIITTTIVMFLFLRRWRPSLIVLVSIPTSLIATFFMMYLFGFTLNLMSLVALSLCIGILVDDSIVVLENIQRHLRMGKDPIRAAIDGRKEIGMAAVAITLCDVVVFGPVAFMSGMVGQFFKEFGLTVVFATLFSLAVSFTVTPMLASRLLRKEDMGEDEESRHHQTQITGVFSRLFNKVTEGYKRFLIWSLDNRWKMIAIITAGVLLSVSLIPLGVITGEFLPSTDQNKLTVNVALTPGSILEQTDEKVKRVEDHLKTLPEVKEYFTSVGEEGNTSKASIDINLVDKTKRKKSQSKLANEIRSWGKKMEGVDFIAIEAGLMGTTSMDGDKPVALNITGPDVKVLKEVSDKVEKIVRSVPGITDVDNTSRAAKSEMNVVIDRLAAAEYGVMAADIAATLRTAVNGANAGVYRKDGNEYDVIVKFAKGQIKTPGDVENIKISSSLGQQVPLGQVASVVTTDSPQEALRKDRQNLVTVTANIQGRTLGQVNREIKKRLGEIKLPYGYSIAFGGDQANMNDSFSSLIKALIASVILVYMILVVLYESYLTPVIRMLSLPCGVIGALAAVAITGNSLNVVTMIGLIMLDGLASKNGTLLIDYTNTLMKNKNLPLREALIESGTTRLRPIMMTTVTMIVGMMPAALALGEGSEIKSGMAIALIGGMITSTLLSPVLLPVVYTLIDDLKKRLEGRKKKKLITYGGTAI